jgi:hypothetical protein
MVRRAPLLLTGGRTSLLSILMASAGRHDALNTCLRADRGKQTNKQTA